MADNFPSLTSSGPSSLATESLLSLGEQEPELVNASDAERFKCPVHHGLLRDPRQTSCGHRLCAECVITWLSGAESRRCPVGESDCRNITVKEVWPDNSIARDMKVVHVYCTNKVNGCPEQRKLRDLKNHITKECKYETVPCPFNSRGCPEKLLRGKLEEHQTKCPFRPEQCRLCHLEVSHNQLMTHENEQCPEKVTGCPYGCGDQKLKSKEVQDHRNVCPVQPVECTFSAIGCKFVAKREDVKKHMKEELSHHLELVTQKAVEMELKNLEIQRQVQEMSVEREELQRNLQSTRGQDQGAHATLQQFESQIRDFRLKLVSLMERLITLERKMPELADKRAIEDITRNVSNIQQRLAQLEQRREQGQEQRQQAAPAAGGGTQDEVQRNIANIVQRIAQLEQRREQAHEQRQLSTLPGGAGAIVRYGTVENMAEAVHVQLTAHDRQLGVHDVRMAEMDLRFQLLETASYDGTLVWKIRDYDRRKRDAVNGRTLSLYSQPFYSHRFGYKMCARVYLNGDGMGKTTHMSLFFVIMRGEYDPLLNWPFRQKVTLTLLDQSLEKRHLTDHFQPDPNSSSFKKPESEMNVASGCPLFVSHAVLENPANGYLKEDTIFIRIVVDQNPNPALF